jgi:hypothetical protein
MRIHRNEAVAEHDETRTSSPSVGTLRQSRRKFRWLVEALNRYFQSCTYGRFRVACVTHLEYLGTVFGGSVHFLAENSFASRIKTYLEVSFRAPLFHRRHGYLPNRSIAKIKTKESAVLLH